MAYLIEKDQIEKYSLTDMEDFPVEYTGQALKALRVKEDESGVEFSDAAGYEYWKLATITDRIKNGYLYPWFAATDARNIAAGNARVPTRTDWNTLMATLGGTTIAGSNMKIYGTDIWTSEGYGGNFGAYPNGLRHTWGPYEGLHNLATWWASSQNSEEMGVTFYIEDLRGDLFQGSAEKKEGRGIRLLVLSPIEISGIYQDYGIYVGNNGVRYECRKFGTQWWTVYNLVETLYQNNDPITLDQTETWGDGIDEGKRCAYENMESNAFVPNEAIINSTDTIEVIAGENIKVELVGKKLIITGVPGASGGASEDIILTNVIPSIENYNTLYAPKYGQSPKLVLLINDGENEQESQHVPVRYKTGGLITRIAWDMPDPISGKIIIYK